MPPPKTTPTTTPSTARCGSSTQPCPRTTMALDTLLIGHSGAPTGVKLFKPADDYIHFEELTRREVQFTKLERGKAKTLAGWAKGDEHDAVTWQRGRLKNRPTGLVRLDKVTVQATVRASDLSPLTGTLTVRALLDGTEWAKREGIAFGAPSGFGIVTIVLPPLPDEVGRAVLKLEWSAEPSLASTFEFRPTTTEHVVYMHNNYPLVCDYDGGFEYDVGGTPASSVDPAEQLTGTDQRLDKLATLLGGRCAVKDMTALYWRVHVGINDTPGAPYFTSARKIRITHNGEDERWRDSRFAVWGTARAIAEEDQWLMWLPDTEDHWNAGSCIGHVQLMKTMLASIGIPGQRVWVYPATDEMPDGSKRTLKMRDLYAIGSDAGAQKWEFSPKYEDSAKIMLMEPRGKDGTPRAEYFEACFRTPAGRLLPGGYTTAGVAKDAPSFVADKGFKTALDVLKWWTSTKRGAFQRFMAWAHVDDGKLEACWGRDGKKYASKDYEKIFQEGNHLRLPEKVT